LLFCHPCAGAGAGGAGDPIAAARQRDAAYFAGAAFAADLADAGVTVGSTWSTRSSSVD